MVSAVHALNMKALGLNLRAVACVELTCRAHVCMHSLYSDILPHSWEMQVRLTGKLPEGMNGRTRTVMMREMN